MKAKLLGLVKIPLFCNKRETHYSRLEARLHRSSRLVERSASSRHSQHWVEIAGPPTCELTLDLLRCLRNLWLPARTTRDKNTLAKKAVSIITARVIDVLPQRSKKLMTSPGRGLTRSLKLQTTMITLSNEVNKFKSTQLKGIRML